MFATEERKPNDIRDFSGGNICTEDGMVTARYLSVDDDRYVAGDRIDPITLNEISGPLMMMSINDTELKDVLLSGHRVIATNSKQRR
jgi:hypothetical protein